MAWGSKTSATQLTSITTEEFFDETPTLNPREIAHCEVTVDFPSSPTDNAVVSVYGTLDDSTEDWDDTPLMEFAIGNDSDPNKVSFIISGLYKFRVGVQRDGSTDTLTSADFSYRKDGVSL